MKEGNIKRKPHKYIIKVNGGMSPSNTFLVSQCHSQEHLQVCSWHENLC